MKKILMFINLSLLIASQPDIFYSGYIDFAYISRLSDKSLINIPYRMASINFDSQIEKLSINGNFSLEYHVRDDAYFLGSSNPQDFILDMRELYLTQRGENYEFRIGKQIHSWGNVDENSPVDNASALDYYYMFFGGAERKMATLSTALDYYFGPLKLNAVFSPLHATNRIPLGDDDFPVKLPVYPDEAEIYPITGLPYELGIYGTLSTDLCDFSASYFSGYDRTFNLSGINVYGRGSDISFPQVDIVYGYRQTDVMGLGFTFLGDFFTLRSDVGYFSTKDNNNSLDRESSSLSSIYDSLHLSYPLLEKAEYLQSTIQVETELPFKINITVQHFMHDTLSYSSDSLPIDQEIDIPNLQIDPEEMMPSNFFTPGMGVPLAILTKEAFLLIMDRTFFDDRLKLSYTSMMDVASYEKISGISGSLSELRLEYTMATNLEALISLTRVSGSNNHPDGENYPFKRMEDFSHIRFELKYFF